MNCQADIRQMLSFVFLLPLFCVPFMSQVCQGILFAQHFLHCYMLFGYTPRGSSTTCFSGFFECSFKGSLLRRVLRRCLVRVSVRTKALRRRAALKGTNLRGQTPICGFLRVPAVFCGFLRKSAVFCENLRFPNALFSRKRRESAKISENQRKSAFGLGLSP